MIRLALGLVCLACLAGCNTTVAPNVALGGPALISGKSPPAALAAHSEPEPVNSLPPGAAGIGAGPLATAPNIASATVRLPY